MERKRLGLARARVAGQEVGANLDKKMSETKLGLFKSAYIVGGGQSSSSSDNKKLCSYAGGTKRNASRVGGSFNCDICDRGNWQYTCNILMLLLFTLSSITASETNQSFISVSPVEFALNQSSQQQQQQDGEPESILLHTNKLGLFKGVLFKADSDNQRVAGFLGKLSSS